MDKKTYFDNILKQFGFNSYREYQLKVKNHEHNTIGEWQYQFCELLNFTFDLEKKVVLDIGAACGAMLKVLKDFYGCKCYGLEIDKDMVDNSFYKKDIELINDEAISIKKYFPNEFFDFIFSVQVFEHFNGEDYTLSVLKQSYDTLKNKSFMYASLEFGEHLTIEQLKKIHEERPLEIDITHINLWPRETWMEWLSRVNFIDVTDIIQPVFDLYYFPKTKWSFYSEYKWHQFFAYKGEIDDLKEIKKKYLTKLEYVLKEKRPPKNICIDFLKNRIYNRESKELIEKYLDNKL